MFKAQVVQTLIIPAHLPILARDGVELLHVTTSRNPALPHAGETLLQVDRDVWVTKRSTRIIDIDRLIRSHHLFPVDDFHRRGEVHSLHANPYKREQRAVHVGLLRMGVWLIIHCFVHDLNYLNRLFLVGVEKLIIH